MPRSGNSFGTFDPKDRTREEKVFLAGSIAAIVVLVLFAGWAFSFFRRMQSGAYQSHAAGTIQDQFNVSSQQQAQQRLQAQYAPPASGDVGDIRDMYNEGGTGQVEEYAPPDYSSGASGQFNDTTGSQ